MYIIHKAVYRWCFTDGVWRHFTVQWKVATRSTLVAIFGVFYREVLVLLHPQKLQFFNGHDSTKNSR